MDSYGLRWRVTLWFRVEGWGIGEKVEGFLPIAYSRRASVLRNKACMEELTLPKLSRL